MSSWKKKLEEHLAAVNRGSAEEAHIVDFHTEEASLEFPLISRSDLPHIERAFLPLSFYGSGEEGGLCPGDDAKILTGELTQTLISGATGSGKTQIFVLPLLSMYAEMRQDKKPSLFIYDPKGENIRIMGEYMKQRGYKIINLDLKTPHRGAHYNPLLELYDSHVEYLRIKEVLEQDKLDRTYRGVTYPTHDEALAAVMERMTELDVYTNQAMEELAELIMPINNEKDTSWIVGGRMILRGILETMLYYGFLGILEREDFTLSNLAYLASSNVDFLSCWLHTCAHIPAVAATLAGQIDLKAQVTRDGYTSTLRTAIGDITSPTVKILTDGNDLDLNDIASGREPYAIFYNTNMMSRSGDTIASMFINSLINICMGVADRCGGGLPRDFVFVLDEFANMRKLPGFSTKISLLRSYRVFLLMVVQSYSQLVQVYGQDTTKIIMDNAVTNYYLGSPDYETKEQFIRSLGKKSVYQTSASIGNDGSLNFSVAPHETPLLHPSDLDRLKLGECYIRVVRHAPLKTYLNPHFMRPDIECAPFQSRPVFRPNRRPALNVDDLIVQFATLLKKNFPDVRECEFAAKYAEIPGKLSSRIKFREASYSFNPRDEMLAKMCARPPEFDFEADPRATQAAESRSIPTETASPSKTDADTQDDLTDETDDSSDDTTFEDILRSILEESERKKRASSDTSDTSDTPSE